MVLESLESGHSKSANNSVAGALPRDRGTGTSQMEGGLVTYVYESVDELTEENHRAGINVQYAQLGKGEYASSFPTQVHSHSTFIAETTLVGVAAFGEMGDGAYFLVGGTDQVTIGGIPLQKDEWRVHPPGSEICALARGASLSVPQVLIPKEFLEDYFDLGEAATDEWRSSRPFRFRTTPRVAKRLRSSIRFLALTEAADDDLAQATEL